MALNTNLVIRYSDIITVPETKYVIHGNTSPSSLRTLTSLKLVKMDQNVHVKFLIYQILTKPTR